MCYKCYKCGCEVDELPTTTESYEFWGNRFTQEETCYDCHCGGEFEEYEDDVDKEEEEFEDDEFLSA